MPFASVQEIAFDVKIEANVCASLSLSLSTFNILYNSLTICLLTKRETKKQNLFFFNTRNCLLQILVMRPHMLQLASLSFAKKLCYSF